MTIANFFLKSRDRRVPQRFHMQEISPRTLEDIKRFARGLTLPEPEHRLYIELQDFVNVAGKGRAPYCLLLYADREDAGFLNAGYVAGQTAVYLHFQGFYSCISRELPYIRRDREDRVCVGIVAFGRAEQSAASGQMPEKSGEPSCVRRDLKGHWTGEVLALAKKRFPISSDQVCILPEDNCVYFSPRYHSGKKKPVSEFETGIAVAYALAAAEELWVDLELDKRNRDSGHTICLTAARG